LNGHRADVFGRAFFSRSRQLFKNNPGEMLDLPKFNSDIQAKESMAFRSLPAPVNTPPHSLIHPHDRQDETLMTSYPMPWPVMTANDLFKSQYQKYLRWAAALTMILTLLLFFLSPPYEANPYRSRVPVIIELLPPPPELEIEPPQEIAPPPSVVEPAPDLEVAEDPEIAETLIPWGESITVPRHEDDPGTGTVFVPSSTKPVLIYQAAPHYPEIARLARIEGTVIVNALVGPDGNVMATVIHSGAHSVLNKAALIAARKCKFEPGRQRSRAVKVWVQIPYRFRLH